MPYPELSKGLIGADCCLIFKEICVRIKPTLMAVLASLPMAFPVSSVASGLNFDETVNNMNGILKCKSPKISPPWYDGGGRLYGCVAGKEQTAKVFVNEDGQTNNVENIKIMWNDWTKGPVHADKKVAQRMLSAVLDKYLPEHKKRLLTVFEERTGTAFEAEKFSIEYRFTKGPAIDERLIILTPK